ncbi:MAG: hypothetical protein ACTHNZ_22110 [Trinickia sp.]|uniref:hypothetical protein n=1 Tax=Trinickia sp. TaxID=2571163 RepID=UPI003F81ADEB
MTNLTGGCVVYNFWGLMLGFCLFACEAVDATEPIASVCANGECVVFVDDKPPAAEALCDGAAVTIRWTVDENVFLTTCEDAGTAEQNTNFLSDAAGNRASKLVYGRPVLKQFVRQHPGGPVPDKFAPRPYCTPPSLQQVAISAFVLLDKLPTNTENGYCFDPTYVHYDQGKVTIDTAKGKVAASDKDYYGAPPTARQRSNLAALIHQYGLMGRPSADAVEENGGHGTVRHVAAERAYLYDTPDEIGKSKTYLIRGDTVVVLKKAGAWVQIRYREANGREIVRWIRSADLIEGQ